MVKTKLTEAKTDVLKKYWAKGMTTASVANENLVSAAASEANIELKTVKVAITCLPAM